MLAVESDRGEAAQQIEDAAERGLQGIFEEKERCQPPMWMCNASVAASSLTTAPFGSGSSSGAATPVRGREPRLAQV
jgi:hypothetical protein